MKILVPVDGSPASEAAVDTVIRQFDPSASDVRVLHIVEAPLTVADSLAFSEAAAAAGIVAEVLEERRRHGQQMTNRDVDRLRAAGFLVAADVRYGQAKYDIVETASRWPAEVVVMGSHGRHGVDRLLTGSVAEHVLRHAACAVEIVRPAHEEVRKAS